MGRSGTTVLRVYQAIGSAVGLGLFGGLVGVVATRRDIDAPGGVDVTTLPEFAIWSTLIIGEIAMATFLAATFAGDVIGVLRRVAAAARPGGRGRGLVTATPFALALLVVAVAYVALDRTRIGSLESVRFPIAGAWWRFLLTYVVVGCGAAVFVAGIIGVRGMLTGALLPRAVGKRLGELLALRGVLQRLGGALTAIVAGSALCAGALRNTVLAAADDRALAERNFPVEYVLLYGGLFTALLAFVYLPAHLRWHERARELRDEVYPLPDDARPTAEWIAARQNLEKLLGLDGGLFATLRPLAAVFAPFAGSLVAVLVPTG